MVGMAIVILILTIYLVIGTVVFFKETGNLYSRISKLRYEKFELESGNNILEFEKSILKSQKEALEYRLDYYEEILKQKSNSDSNFESEYVN